MQTAEFPNFRAVIVDQVTAIHCNQYLECQIERARPMTKVMIPTTTKDVGGSVD